MTKTKDLSKFTVNTRQGEKSFGLLKRILHYTRWTMNYSFTPYKVAWALYWKKLLICLCKQIPENISLKELGICRLSKFYLKILEEISFISKNIIFNDAVIIDLVNCDGVKW